MRSLVNSLQVNPVMKRAALLACFCLPATAGLDVVALVSKSVAQTERNWREAPNYVHTEHDIQEKLDGKGQSKTRVDKTYEVYVIDGSQYNRLLAVNGKPLAPEADRAEQARMKAETERRLHESPSQRAKRVAKYERERSQDQAMMREMASAFDWKLAGEDQVNGRAAYVLEATPKRGYVSKMRDLKVLTGMKGKLWIDKAESQWVKVEAEVVRPVSFYAVATVSPGTKFILEQEPVGEGLWMPKHFAVRVNSSVLFFARNSNDDERYSGYKRTSGQEARTKTAAR